MDCLLVEPTTETNKPARLNHLNGQILLNFIRREKLWSFFTSDLCAYLLCINVNIELFRHDIVSQFPPLFISPIILAYHNVLLFINEIKEQLSSFIYKTSPLSDRKRNRSIPSLISIPFFYTYVTAACAFTLNSTVQNLFFLKNTNSQS